MNTYDLATALKTKLGLKSDYALAKYLGLSQQAVSLWKTVKQCDDDMAIRLAEELGYDPSRILLEIQGHRTSCQITKNAFLAYAESMPLIKVKKKKGLTKKGKKPTNAAA